MPALRRAADAGRPVPGLSTDLEQELDRLYGLPLAEFTPARNELSARLRKEGRVDEATEVKALAKPSASADVLNQLARAEPGLVRKLLDAGEALRSAQASAMGGGGAEPLRAATAAERQAVQELVHAARRLPGSLSQATLDRVQRSLSAAIGDDESRALLERGRVTKDFEFVGFPTLTPTTPPRDEVGERRRIRELQQRLRDLKRRLVHAEEQARSAEREADAAVKARDAAVRTAQELADEAARVEEELR